MIHIFTDGGFRPSKGFGAWAFVLVYQGEILHEFARAGPLTTSNQMELWGMIEALRHLREELPHRPAVLYSDSQYLVNGASYWVDKWVRNGWRTGDDKPVKNRELWSLLHGLKTGLNVYFQWVKGHDGNPYNERADKLCQEAIKEAYKNKC